MSDTTHRPRRARRFAVAAPLLAACGLLAGGTYVAQAMTDRAARHDPASDLVPASFGPNTGASGASDLRTALEAACAETGCDAAVLHSVILATTPRMSAADLAAERATQARMLREALHLQELSPPGTPAARMAELERRTADRLDAFYELEHERARRQN